MLKPEEVEFLKEYARDCGLPEFARYALMLVEKHTEMELYPIYVPSYNVNEKRRTIQNLLAEGIPCTVCIYSNQIERYKELGCTDFIEVDPSVKTSYHNPVAYKRNLILDHAKKRGANKIFMLDDDMMYVQLPYLVEKSYGIVADLAKTSVNIMFHMWQIISDDQDIDMLGAPHGRQTTRFGIKDVLTEGATRLANYIICTVLMRVTDLRYDTGVQWDDLDMFMQFLLSGKKCRQILHLVTYSASSVLDYHTKCARVIDSDIIIIERYGIEAFRYRLVNHCSYITVQRSWQRKKDKSAKPCKLSPGVREKLLNLIEDDRQSLIHFILGKDGVEIESKFKKRSGTK